MRSVTVLLLPVLLLSVRPYALISQTSSPSGVGSFTPTSATISGQVLNVANGQPVPRALVRFNHRAMLTDHEGRFRFDQVTETTITLQAIKPGFSMTGEPSDPGGQTLQVANIAGPIQIQLYPEALLTGNISSPDGAPLARISVIARRNVYDESGHRWAITGQTQTDRHGDFRIPVTPGDYKLETLYVPRSLDAPGAILPVILPASGGDGATQSIHLRPGQEQHFDIRPPIVPTYPVAISVESHGERGIPSITAHTSNGISFNVGVSTRDQRQPGPNSSERTIITLPAGTYTLTANARTRDTNETAETRVHVTGSSSDPPVAVLRFVSSPSIPVELTIDSGATSDNTQSNAQGSSPVASNTSSSALSLAQKIPTLQQFGLALQRLNPISEDENNSIGLAYSRSASSLFTVSPGTYRLLARTTGRWYIRSATYGTANLTQSPITITSGGSGATINIVVSNLTGTLQGMVLLNSIPYSAWVYLLPDSPALPAMVTLHSGSTGVINNPYIPPGTYRVIAFERRQEIDFVDPNSLAPYLSFIQTVTVGPGASTSVNLNAVPQLTVEGRP